ncbi:MAG: hypothetical protein A2W76_11820 [Gammaproteobacteria bacterium RIFCSPLOWO2_12_47_11]|jgi:hypothetical protein|nr:MAG: hypothetical protein A2W76_11820 [Gammaproteobacteria bacterium RIFCSPLOWO2_12_47_11]
MKNTEFDLVDIKDKEIELQSLVNDCGKPELVHCVRLLSMYVALYKKAFGDLPPASFEKILASDNVDADTARIFENGMLEAITILEMVLQSRAPGQSYQYAGITIN